MKSHEYAKKLREVGEFLLDRPEFDTGTDLHLFFMYYAKDGFLAAVKALGSGQKELTTGSYPEIKFRPSAYPEIVVSTSRDKVCTKVQEEKWECEPLLTQEEEAQVG